MRPSSAIAAASLLLVTLALPSQSYALCVARKQLSGTWTGSDRTTYKMHRFGDELWWVGENDLFINVFKGTVNGDFINGVWADVRHKVKHGTGTLRIQIVRTPGGGIAFLKKVSGSGSGFGNTKWTYPCNDS